MNNYQRLGNYIEEIDVRNTDLAVDTLLGVSISKEFIPSVANTVGTNMKRYKVIEKNQFACSIMQIRRDKKMPIALLKNYDKALVSQAYPVFKVKDENILLPDYLMMWFSRSEFDRQATFWAIGGVRGSLEWEDFLDFEIPVPSIEKQQMIVDEYNAITKKINLNEQLNQKLEQTAQSLYKHWFVDFEFPNEQGKPYKSNGGEMVYNTELDKEIPKGWEVVELEKVIDFKNGKKRPQTLGKYPVYGGNGIIDSVNEYNAEEILVIGRVGAYCGSLYLEYEKCWVSDNAISGKAKNNDTTFCLFLLQNLNIADRREGTGQPLITQSILNNIQMVLPKEKLRWLFDKKVNLMFIQIILNENQNDKLRNLQSLLLSKMSKD